MKYPLLLSLVLASVAIAAPDIAREITQNDVDRAYRIIKEHRLLTPKALRCSEFTLMDDGSNKRVRTIGGYETHNKVCGGDPSFALHLFDLEIDMKTGTAKWDLCPDGEMRPIPRAYTSYEVFRASCP